jgi:hypothetical protein
MNWKQRVAALLRQWADRLDPRPKRGRPRKDRAMPLLDAVPMVRE